MEKTQTEQEMLEKQFSHNGVEIVSRMDYESLPCPMQASEFTDEQMQELADLIYEGLCAEYDEDEVNDYFAGDCNDEISESFWEEMENAAQHLGMKYYED